MTTIYVGNLSFKTDEDQLLDLFAEYGDVSSAKIITDRETGRSRGFGFVDMDSNDEAESAIDDLHEAEFMSRALVVNKARPRKENNGFRGNNRY